MSSFSHIKVGRPSNNKSIHNLSHDVHTTSGFGFVQPVDCTEVIPGDTITIQHRTKVQMMPMISATFGRIMVKHYHRYVPMTDVYKAFENFLTGIPVSTAQYPNGYIPIQLPYMRISDLTYLLCTMSYVTYYTYDSSKKILDLDTPTLPADTFIPGKYTQGYLGQVFVTSGIVKLQSENNRVTLEEADFIIEYNKGQSGSSIAAVKLKEGSKNLRKILIGLGYQLSPTNQLPVSILPILAFYKAYFDEHVVKRNIAWTDTAAFRVIDQIFEYNASDLISFYSGQPFGSYFRSFLTDLYHAYYNADPDYFTSQLDTPSLAPATGVDIQDVSSLAADSKDVYANSQPTTISDISGENSVISLKVAQRLYSMVNKQSIFGRNLRASLEAIYGADSLVTPETNAVGVNQFMLDIGTIKNLAESNTSPLGEFTGTGDGSNISKKFKFNNGLRNKDYGYLISTMCVVPQSSYSQAIHRQNLHLDKTHFGQTTFDGLGFQITNKGEYIGCNDVVTYEDLYGGTATHYHTQPFGFALRYQEYKAPVGSIVNGDISRRGTRQSLLPFTLDRWFTTKDVKYDHNWAQGVGQHFEFVDGYVPTTVNPYMRTLGANAAMGNFNRIFISSGDNSIDKPLDAISTGGEDQFIISSIFEIKRISVLKPVADSYETDEDFNPIQLEHQ